MATNKDYFTKEQKVVIAKFLAHRFWLKKCDNCIHYRGCEGEYWDWSKTCKSCNFASNWKPNKSLILDIVNKELKDL